MKTLGDRIKYIREEILKKSQQEFADMLSLKSRQSISEYENNRTEPSVTTINLISMLGDVRHEWLLTGEGAPKYSEDKARIELLTTEIKKSMDNMDKNGIISLTDEESDIICLLRKLPNSGAQIKKLLEGKLMISDALKGLES